MERAVSKVSIDLRRVRFAQVVEAGLASAKDRGMTIPKVEQATGVGKSTIYRWRDGGWSIDPRITEVQGFCDGLGVPRSEAYAALGWSERLDAERAEPEPSLDPRLRAVARRLSDPNVSLLEKVAIQQLLESMAKGKFAPEE